VRPAQQTIDVYAETLAEEETSSPERGV
jgi:hypothetical protein